MSRPIDPAKIREGALLASALGLAEAGRRLNLSPSQLCEYRKRYEAASGERLPRKYHWRGQRSRKLLTTRQEMKLREQRRRNVSWAVLARIYKVSRTTCQRIAADL